MSARAAWQLELFGFVQVFRYIAGKYDWMMNGLPIEGHQAGQQAYTAGHVARKAIPTCAPTAPLGAVAQRLREQGQKVCLVVNQEHVVLGRVRERHFDAAAAHTPVAEVMEIGPTTTRPGTSLDQLVERMHHARVSSMVVTTNDGQLVGILYRQDAEQQLVPSRTET